MWISFNSRDIFSDNKKEFQSSRKYNPNALKLRSRQCYHLESIFRFYDPPKVGNNNSETIPVRHSKQLWKFNEDV